MCHQNGQNSPMSNTVPASKHRRNFLYYATGAVGAGIVGYGLLQLGKSMAPTASVNASGKAIISIDNITEGQQIVIKYGGKPIFIRHLTAYELQNQISVTQDQLPDPHARNANLVPSAKAIVENRISSGTGPFVILSGICPREGCVPLSNTGDFDGWFCPCGGTHFDTLGRVRKGLPTTNMLIPRHTLSAQNILTLLPPRTGPSKDVIQNLLFGTNTT